MLSLWAKRSEGAEDLLSKRARNSFFMYIWESLTTHKILKMVVETSDKKKPIFLVLRLKRSEDVEGILAERTRSSFYMYIWESSTTQKKKHLKMVVETSNKNQFSYFYILNSFLKKVKKMGLGHGVWGRAPAEEGGWYICSAYQCLHLLVIYTVA